MKCKWPLKSLEQLGVKLIDCVHKTPKEVEIGVPYIGIPQMKSGEIDFNAKPRLISKEDFITWTTKANPKFGDVILSRRCNPGDTAFVPKDKPFALGQNLVLLRPDASKLHPGYLRWVTQGQLWWHEVERYKNPGAVFDSLKCADIPKFLVPEPPRNVQVLIDETLLSISDKISLNREKNKTLEQIAQAIFKSWFVDFEPVKAKIAAREALIAEYQTQSVKAPSPQEIAEVEKQAAIAAIAGAGDIVLTEQLQTLADLFPNQLVESELGVIPEGWEISEIGDEVAVVGGGTPSTKNSEFWDGGEVAWTTPKDLSNTTDKILIKTDRKITEKGLSKISSGLLPVDTVLMSSRAPVGYLALAKVPLAVNQGYIAMKCEYDISPEFVIQWCQSAMDEIKQRASGTTFSEISKKNFKLIKIVKPAKILVDSYSSVVCSLYEQITINIKQSNSLSELRDALLPKLLNGEIEITNKEIV